MNRRFFLPVLTLSVLALSLALHAGLGETETVNYKSGSDTVNGYLALPEGAASIPPSS